MEWLIDSKNGQVAPKGHTAERLLNLTTLFWHSLDEENQLNSPIEDCILASQLLHQLAVLLVGDDWKNVFKINIALPAGPRSLAILSKILDALPPAMQCLIQPIVIKAADEALQVDTSARNTSVQAFWDLVIDNLAIFEKATFEVCPPTKIRVINKGPSEVSDVADKFAAALEKSNKANLMNNAASSDNAESKAAEAGTKVDKAKIMECVTSDSEAGIAFRAAVTKAMAAPSEYLGWQILLANTEAFRLLNVKLPASVTNTSPLLMYVSKMRNYQFMEMEKDFGEKHGGRYSHSETSKLVTRALLMDEHFWSGNHFVLHDCAPLWLHPNTSMV